MGGRMRQASGMIEVDMKGQGLLDITRRVTGWVDAHSMEEGLLTLFCRHTSASLLIQENAAPPPAAILNPTSRALHRNRRPMNMTRKDRTTCPRTCARR
jgi:thiamine phosphate synthase YjbQ (UPF0047 family)